MAEEHPASATESLLEKISEKIHGHDASSSSSSSESQYESDQEEEAVSQPKTFRLFGRGKPLHQALGGGKPADALMWRNKKVSATILGVATAIWVFFILLEYHLLTLVCHISICSLSSLFFLSNATMLLKKTPLCIPEIYIPEEPLMPTVSSLVMEINSVFSVLRNIASGRNLKKFLMVVGGLWILSIVGSWCNFLTLLYIVFVLLHTVPVLYEKYEHKVDPIVESSIAKVKKQSAAINCKIMELLPKKKAI